MKILESAEDYLEAILMIKERKGYVRAIDIANELGYSKPSVSIAMKNFRENGYATTDENGHIELTPLGQEIAVRTYERHLLLTKLLMLIGVDEETAEKDACKIEHDISVETFHCLQVHYEQHLKNGN